jgi:hypothetical protein
MRTEGAASRHLAMGGQPNITSRRDIASRLCAGHLCVLPRIITGADYVEPATELTDVGFDLIWPVATHRGWASFI